MTDNAPASHMYGVVGFGHGGVTPSYNGIGEPGRPCGEFSQYGSQYPQYNQGGVRPGYVGGPVMQKEAAVPNRHGMNWGSMNSFPPGPPRYPPSGGMPGTQQPQLPTSSPTLNQLLQSPSSDQRYAGMYGEYGNPKTAPGVEDLDQIGYGGWTGQQRMNAVAYQQQMLSGPMPSPNQGIGGYDMNRRQSSGMGNRYPPPPPHPPPSGGAPIPSHHGPPPSQNPSQYLANSQPNLLAMNQLCGQMQQRSLSPNPSLPPAPSHPQLSPSTTPLSQHSDQSGSSSSNIKAQSSPQATPTSKQKSKKQTKRQQQQQTKQQSNPQSFAKESFAAVDESERLTPRHGAMGNSSHHGVASGQPPNAALSPVGSVSSRSNTPASLSGNMVGSPSTNQHDGQNRILSPFHGQGGSGQMTNIPQQQHQQHQQMMPPPSMFPSHGGASAGSSKGHVPLPPPSPQLNSSGSSQQMASMSYNNVQYNMHYAAGRGPPGSHAMSLMPGYNGGHPEHLNGPNNPPQGYGVSGGAAANRPVGYLGSFGNADGAGLGGYGMHPVGPAPGMPMIGAPVASGTDSSFPAASPSTGDRGAGGKPPTSMEGNSFSGQLQQSSTAEAFVPNVLSSSEAGAASGGRSSHPSGIDAEPGRNPYGMSPSYELGPQHQQQQQQQHQQQNMTMGFGKPFPHGIADHHGSGLYAREHAPGIPIDERSRPLSRSMDNRDLVGGRVGSAVGMAMGETSNPVLKRPYDTMSFHGDGALTHQFPPNHPMHYGPSHGHPSGMTILPNIPGYSGQHRRTDDLLHPYPLPPTQPSMGPPASSSYPAVGDQQAAIFGAREASESHSNYPAGGGGGSGGGSGGVASSGFPKDKWGKLDYFHPNDGVGERERPRIYDEGSMSDTQSSDMGTILQSTDDSSRLSGALSNEQQTGGELQISKTLSSSTDDGKKPKASKSKKAKQEKMSSLVHSPMTPDRDALDDISNASRPSSPKSDGNDIVNRLAEMGDEPDRRIFLERLFAFMEEIGTPIISLPMISKTAIDLYKLYRLVREHGGMVEVTRNKKWRDVSAALSIGPSSSAGFTLKKNYGKHLFAFECRFDRGNVDPAPLLAMLEQPTKKESKKAAAERAAAAAAASNQDMYRMQSGQQFGCYRGPGGSGPLPSGLDHGSGPMMGSASGMMPLGAHPMSYGGPGMIHGMTRPNSNISNGSMMHPGADGAMPLPHGMGGNVMAGPGLQPHNSMGENVSVQDPFSDVPSQGPGTFHRPNVNYFGPGGGSGGGILAPRGSFGGPGSVFDGHAQKMPFCGGGTPAMSKALLSPPMGGAGVAAYEGGQSDPMDGPGRAGPDGAVACKDNFGAFNERILPEPGNSNSRTAMDSVQMTHGRFENPQQLQPPLPGETPGQAGKHSLPHEEQGESEPGFYGGPHGGPQQQMRLMNDQQMAFNHGGYGGGYPGGQRILPHATGGGDSYYPGGAPPGMSVDPASQQQLSYLAARREMLTPSPLRPHLMKTDPRDGYNPCYDGRKDQHWMAAGGMTLNRPMGYTPNAMLHSISQQPGYNHSSQKLERSAYPPSDRKSLALPSRSDISFPLDSVEATPPRLVKRKKFKHKQLGPVDPWKLLMSLKSGLIAESSAALEVLSILLHDEATVVWFGLQHLPGLIEVLLEHFRRCLIQIFPNDFDDFELGLEAAETYDKTGDKDKSLDILLSLESEADGSDDKQVFLDGSNFTLKTRTGEKVIFEECSLQEKLIVENKQWDECQEIDSSVFDWQMGRGDSSAHLVTHFAPGDSVKFCREKFFSNKRSTQQAKKNSTEDSTVSDPSVYEKKEEFSVKQEEDKSLDVVACKKEEERMEVTEEEESTLASDRCSDEIVCNQDACDKSAAEDAEDAMEEEVKALERLKRKWTEDEDIEVHQQDEQLLQLVNESEVEISRRCLCICNIFRSLSFVPGNDSELSKHPGLLLILGKLLMLNHTHTKVCAESQKTRAPCGEEADDLPTGPDSKTHWSTEALDVLREDTLVILANVAGQMDLSQFPEEIVSPILDGLLHWVTCTAACAQDPLPTMPSPASLSPKRLVLETLCKLCITDCNVDLLLAMPPYSRTVIFLSGLVQLVAESADQVVREFAIVLISSLVQADSSAARAIALHRPSISILLDFIESADHCAMHVANTQGLTVLKDSPEMMGTSLDMLRRAASVLCHIAEVPENKTIFARYHQRLLHLVMSQIMDQKVASILAEVLYHSSSS